MALLVVVALLIWAVVAVVGLFSAGRDDAGGRPAPAAGSTDTAASPSASSSARPSGSADSSQAASASGDASGQTASADAAGGQCASDDIKVTAATDRPSYGTGDKPVLEMKITNAGSEDCTLNVGTSQQEFKLVSGSDRIFSTTDCRADPTDADMILKAGATETARFTWDRQRSAPGCKDVSTKPRPGTYGFTAKLGDVESDKTTFTLE